MRRGIVSALPCRACWKERNDTLFGSTRLNFPSHTERIRAAPLPFCACPSLSDSAHVIAFPWPSDADLCRFIFLRAYSDAWMLCSHPSLAFAMQERSHHRLAKLLRRQANSCLSTAARRQAFPILFPASRLNSTLRLSESRLIHAMPFQRGRIAALPCHIAAFLLRSISRPVSSWLIRRVSVRSASASCLSLSRLRPALLF